jgi:hypothetical protein
MYFRTLIKTTAILGEKIYYIKKKKQLKTNILIFNNYLASKYWKRKQAL